MLPGLLWYEILALLKVKKCNVTFSDFSLDTLNQSNSGRRYRFFSKKVTYEEAVQTCNSSSGITYLMNIGSVEEAQIVLKLMDEHRGDSFVKAWVGQIQGEG